MSDMPMPDANDARLERELRDLLADRDPGAAPYTLRGRVDRVPETAARSPNGARVAAGVIGALVVAAAAVIVVVALGNRGALDATGVGASPGPGNLSRALGPGIVDYPDIAQTNQVAAFVALGCLAVAAVLALRRRRRASLVVLAVMFAIPVAATALSLLPGAVADESDGAYVTDIVRAEMPAGYRGRQLVYAAGQPFRTGFSIANAGPLPIRLNEIVSGGDSPWKQVDIVDDPIDLLADPLGDPGRAPSRPFQPLTLGPQERAFIVLTGAPDSCGVVLANPASPPPGTDFRPATISVSYDVLGWPRVSDLEPTHEIVFAGGLELRASILGADLALELREVARDHHEVETAQDGLLGLAGEQEDEGPADKVLGIRRSGGEPGQVRARDAHRVRRRGTRPAHGHAADPATA